MLVKGSKALRLGIALGLFGQPCLLGLIVEVVGGNVSSPAVLEQLLGHVGPRLETLELLGAWHCEFFGKLHQVGLLIHLEKTLGRDRGCCENTGELRSQEVALLAGEGGDRVDLSVQVASQEVLDLTGGLDVRWLDVGQLNPVVQQIISHPEHELVSAGAAFLNSGILARLLGLNEHTAHKPVVLACSEHLAGEAHTLSAAHDGESLDRFGEAVSVFFAEANAGPLEHLSLLGKVWHRELLLLDHALVSLAGEVVDFVEQVAALLNPVLAVALGLRTCAGLCVNLKIALGVLERQMSAFDQCGNLLKLIVGVGLMVQHDSVKDFSQVAVEVLGDAAANFLGFS